MRLHEEMLHLLPNFQHLVMGFVGPDFPITGKDSQRAIGVECSDNPLAAKHPPNIFVAFSSGHADAETHTWKTTLQKILDTGALAVFTIYDRKEALEEGSVFEEMDAVFLVAKYEIYHQNFWRYVVNAKKLDGCKHDEKRCGIHQF